MLWREKPKIIESLSFSSEMQEAPPETTNKVSKNKRRGKNSTTEASADDIQRAVSAAVAALLPNAKVAAGAPPASHAGGGLRPAGPGNTGFLCCPTGSSTPWINNKDCDFFSRHGICGFFHADAPAGTTGKYDQLSAEAKKKMDR